VLGLNPPPAAIFSAAITTTFPVLVAPPPRVAAAPFGRRRGLVGAARSRHSGCHHDPIKGAHRLSGCCHSSGHRRAPASSASGRRHVPCFVRLKLLSQPLIRLPIRLHSIPVIDSAECSSPSTSAHRALCGSSSLFS
jgi:hypothetical protein